MSHFTHIETLIRDKVALKDACTELGVELHENTQARGYAGQNYDGELVIKLSGPYDVALNKREDGNYQITADLWAGHVEKELGQDYCKLKQMYGIHKATREARCRGLSVRRRDVGQGKIRLTLTQVGG